MTGQEPAEADELGEVRALVDSTTGGAELAASNMTDGWPTESRWERDAGDAYVWCHRCEARTAAACCCHDR